MTFLQVVNIIRDTAFAQPNVNTVVREFLDLNREDTKYSAVVIQDRDGNRDRIVEQDWNTYTFHLGYVDRLTFDESNRDDIFSTGMNVINNIVASIRERWDLEVSVIDRFSTFNQRFTASCAGVYVVLAIQVPISDCVDGEETDLYDKFEVKITENGDYHFVPDGRPVDEIDITVDVPEKILKRMQTSADLRPSVGMLEYDPADVGADGFNYVQLEMGAYCTNVVKTFTSNGNYRYDIGDQEIGDNYIDYVDITVAVPTERKPEQVGHFEVTDWGTSYLFYPDPGYVLKEVEVVNATPVMTYTSTVTSNGSLRWEAGEGGSLVSMLDINVNVHPSQSLVESITSNGSYHYTGEWKDADITVAVSAAKPEESLVETISSNGSYSFSPTPGSVFSDASISVDVHPSTSLSRTYTTNGTKTITGEFNGGTVTISVHPSASLSKRYTRNGTYTESGEYAGAQIVVAVSDIDPVPENNEIYYRNYTAGETITLFDDTDFGANLVSNVVVNSDTGWCLLTFDGPVLRSGRNSFNSRVGLQEIILPDTVQEISYNSFGNTGLQRIKMPETITQICGMAFHNCFALISHLNLPNACQYMGDNDLMSVGGSFKGCTALTVITIPGRCVQIAPSMFQDCVNLRVVRVLPTTPPVLLESAQNTYNQFDNNYVNRRIYVPAASYQAYLTAPGWSDYASDIYSL